MSQDLRRYVDDLGSADWRVALRAEEALVAAGAEASRILARHMLQQVADLPVGVMRALVRIGHSALPALRTVLEQGSDKRRAQAVQCIGEIRSPEVADLLCCLLADADTGVTAAAADGLRRRGEASLPYLCRAAREGSPTEKAAALQALADLGDSEGLQVIRESVSDRDPSVRALALRLLGGRVEPEMLEAAVLASFDHDLEVREAALTALLAPGDPSRLELLRAALAEKSESARGRCAEALVRYLDIDGVPELLASLVPARTLTPLLLERLKGLNAQERENASRVLRLLPQPPFAELAALLRHPVAGVRDSAVEVLGAYGERALPWIVDLGIAGLQRQEWLAVTEVLVRVGPPSAPWLCQACLSAWGSQQESAVRALGRIRAPEAIPTLIQLIESGDAVIPAAEALAQIARKHQVSGLRKAVPLLRRRMAVWSFPSASEQRAYQEALSAIEAATERLKDLPLPSAGEDTLELHLPRPATAGPPPQDLPRVRDAD